MLLNVANNEDSVLGTDSHGNTWAAQTNADDTQTWVQMRDGQITNGGVNSTPRTWNPQTGLSASTPPKGK